ncbi:MAG: tRNA lysidine(34) synthetase TilS [candidate division WOR-3 bacterium]
MGRKQHISVLGRFVETVDRAEMLPQGAKVLVAVSGGADSVCLFDLLRSVAPGRGIELVGFHMNHRLRPTAYRDEMFVRDLFGSVPLVVVRADVVGYARRHRLGIEEAGRELRYRHMVGIARKRGCSLVALGHTADDNLETMLLNLARGAGLTGLAGVPVRRGIFIRPLIDIERTEIVAYLRARGLTWVEDESNQNAHFRRNLVRLTAVPALKAVNPRAAVSARRTAELLSEEDSFLDGLAREALNHVATVRRGRVCVDCAAFRLYDICLRRRMARQLLPGLDSVNLSRAVEFLAPGPDATLKLNRFVRLIRRSVTPRRPTGVSCRQSAALPLDLRAVLAQDRACGVVSDSGSSSAGAGCETVVTVVGSGRPVSVHG